MKKRNYKFFEKYLRELGVSEDLIKTQCAQQNDINRALVNAIIDLAEAVYLQ